MMMTVRSEMEETKWPSRVAVLVVKNYIDINVSTSLIIAMATAYRIEKGGNISPVTN